MSQMKEEDNKDESKTKEINALAATLTEEDVVVLTEKMSSLSSSITTLRSNLSLRSNLKKNKDLLDEYWEQLVKLRESGDPKSARGFSYWDWDTKGQRIGKVIGVTSEITTKDLLQNLITWPEKVSLQRGPLSDKFCAMWLPDSCWTGKPQDFHTSFDSTSKMSCLSDKAIKRAREKNKIIIEPFVESQLGSCSYDVTLGPHYFREQKPMPGPAPHLFVPYDKDEVLRVWGKVQKAVKASEYKGWPGNILPTGIGKHDEVILLEPGETILGHTVEFIGGQNPIVGFMQCRSGVQRSLLSVCKCSGWSNIGWTNRWAMEITNNSRFYSIPLVVGRRIAQIIFFETEGSSKSYKGNYEPKNSEKDWDPHSMLPCLYKDL